MEGKNVIDINESQMKRIIKETILKALKGRKGVEEIDIEKLFNFNAIPEKELMDQYVDLSFAVSSSGYGGKFVGVNGNILKEEATSTLSIEETKKEIQNKFHLKDWQFATEKGANGIQLVILYPGIFRNTRLIKRAMSACGWSLAIKGYIVKNKMIWRAMSFDPMFQDDVSEEARKNGYLLHWTPKYNLQSIIANGLTPRSENSIFDYPNRLHLIKGDASQTEIMNIGWQLYKTNKRKENNGDYFLLFVDMHFVPNDIEFFYDPRYEWGYYVKDKIPANAIKPIVGYNFKNKMNIPL